MLGSAYEGEWKPKLFPGMNVRRGYMLMEKAPGESLQKLIQFGGGLTYKQGNSAFQSLMKARKAIHMRGVAHQDMHPGNIMLDLKSERLTVLDLGMARIDFTCRAGGGARPHAVSDWRDRRFSVK